MPLSIRTLVLAAIALPLSTPIVHAQSLRGSRVKVQRVHNHAVREGFDFYRTPKAIRQGAQEGVLVRLENNADFVVNTGVQWPYVQPAVKTFVNRLAAQYRAACGERLVVTSAVRPLNAQPHNASDRSVHPTGMALDLRKPRGRCLTWLRSTLVALDKQGLISATEEFRPPHFHVAVYPRPYADYIERQTKRVIAASAPASTAAPAGATRSSATSVATRRYEVRKGDTLWGIARKHGVSVARLQALNTMRGSTIKPGQAILVPARGA